MSENTVYMAMLIFMILAAVSLVSLIVRIVVWILSKQKRPIPYSDVARLGNVMLGREVPDGES